MQNLYLDLLAIDLVCKKYIYIFITFLGIEIFFIKQCPLKVMSGNT